MAESRAGALPPERDPRLREDLDAHFRRRGFRVTVCGDGSHGLEAAG
ncbi:DNA-binding response regulator, partial [Pseudomonas aeruginosa]|nr:DNA-binding response regulator [Pseudomonas aeruginosa]